MAPARDGEAVLELEHVGPVQRVGAQLLALLVLVVGSEGEGGAGGEFAAPVGHEIAAGRAQILRHGDGARPLRGGARVVDERGLPHAATIVVALEDEAVAAAGVPFEAETGTLLAAVVVGIEAEPSLALAAFEALGVGSVGEAFAEGAALLEERAGPLLRPCGQREARACLVPRGLGDDVDHAVDGVRAPGRAAGAADGLDALDLLDGDAQRLPHRAGEERAVDAAPVEQHLHLVGEASGEAAGRDGPLVALDAGHLEAGNQSQRLGQAADPCAPQVVRGNHERRGRRRPHLPLGAAGRGHRNLHQLLDAEIEQVAGLGDHGAQAPAQSQDMAGTWHASGYSLCGGGRSLVPPATSKARSSKRVPPLSAALSGSNSMRSRCRPAGTRARVPGAE